MKVVGVGCGPGMLTEQAIRAISAATVILGSRRAIALARAYIPEGCRVGEMTTFSPDQDIPAGAVILSTGDPSLAGLGYLGGEIVPGISSLQVACARLGIPLERVVVVIAHGKEHERAYAEVAAEVERGRIVFVIADPKFSIATLAGALAGAGEELSIAVCEDLGYPDERVWVGSVADPPVAASRLFSVVVGRAGMFMKKPQIE